MTPEPLCGEHKRGCDPEHKRVCDPFSLATTSVARASAVGLEKLETLEALEELEKLEELVRLEPLEHLEKLETLEKQARNEKKTWLICAKKRLILGDSKEKTYICSDKRREGLERSSSLLSIKGQ